MVTDCSLFGSHRFISSLTLPASLMTPVFFSFFIFAVGDCPLLRPSYPLRARAAISFVVHLALSDARLTGWLPPYSAIQRCILALFCRLLFSAYQDMHSLVRQLHALTKPRRIIAALTGSHHVRQPSLRCPRLAASFLADKPGLAIPSPPPFAAAFRSAAPPKTLPPCPS